MSLKKKTYKKRGFELYVCFNLVNMGARYQNEFQLISREQTMKIEMRNYVILLVIINKLKSFKNMSFL